MYVTFEKIADAAAPDLDLSAQYIVLCELCNESGMESYCKRCQQGFCNKCAGKHLSHLSKSHKVVSYTEKFAVESKAKRKKIKKDLEELENKIQPLYVKIALGLQSEKTNVEKHYERVDKAITRYKENWLKVVNEIARYEKSRVTEFKSKHISTIEHQENRISSKLAEIEEHISYLKKLLDTSKDFIAGGYESRNAEFKKLPSTKTLPLPEYVAHRIDENELYNKFGFVTFSSVTQDEDGHIVTNSLPRKTKVIKTIATENDDGSLGSVSCFGDDKIWTTVQGKIIELHNLDGKLLKSVKTRSRNDAWDITTTKRGYLVYSDPGSKTVNRMRKKHIKELIRLRGWTPCCVCSTSLDGLLLTMISEDRKPSKVVRYTDSCEEKQTIQLDDRGNPLYSTRSWKLFVSENRNLDVCVADTGANAVVVVNQTGNLRFRYTGPHSSSKPLKPDGITTDSQCRILIADSDNHKIHILDQDGEILRFITSDLSDSPFRLCVDTRNNLFVPERNSGNIKMIAYT